MQRPYPYHVLAGIALPEGGAPKGHSDLIGHNPLIGWGSPAVFGTPEFTFHLGASLPASTAPSARARRTTIEDYPPSLVSVEVGPRVLELVLMTVTREKLYEEVWAEAMIKVAAQYGVSGSFLARVCRDLNVPCPPRGYWARLRAGYSVSRPELPKALPGGALEWSRDGVPRTAPRPLPQPPDPSERPATTRVRKGTPHPLVTGIQQYFDAARVSKVGYLRPLKRAMVDIFVTKETLPHALQTAGKLFAEFESRGYRVTLAPYHEHFHRPGLGQKERNYYESSWDNWYPDRATVVYLGTLAMGLSLYEAKENVRCRLKDGKWERVSRPAGDILVRHSYHDDWTSMHDLPSGQLVLRAYAPYSDVSWQKEWTEAKNFRLAAMAKTICDELEHAAPKIVELVAEAARKAEEWRLKCEAEHREWERQRAEEHRRQALKDSRDQILSIVDAWVRARNIEVFFEDARRRAEGLPADERATYLDRLERARQMFGGTDALQHFRSWKSPEER